MQSGEKGQPEVSTAGILVSTASATIGTASETLIVSTANINVSTASTIHSEILSTAGRFVYSRRSDETRKDKGKAIMTEPEPRKKSKKELEQERLSFVEAIRLQEQDNEEKLAQIARDEEITKQWAEQERQRIKFEANETKEINWNDPSVQSYDEIRPIFERVWKFNQDFLAKESEEVQKEEVEAEKVEEDVKPEQIEKEVSKKSGGKRRKILDRKRTKDAQDKETSKRQKLDKEEADDQEEEDITQYIVIADVEEITINDVPLATRPPIIVDVEIVSEGQMSSYYIIRADGSLRRYSTMTLIFQDIDREDLENLWKIVKGKFKDASPEENYKRVLWGDLKVMFEPDMESEIWRMIENYDVTT
ncbi:hypothetical protein Tco_1001619 [Tanacetum coccineum]